LSSQLRQPFKLTIALRGSEEERTGPVFDEISQWEKQNLISVESRDSFDDWSRNVPKSNFSTSKLNLITSDQKTGPCQYLLMKPIILADGQVSACGARDMEGQLIIGDLNKNSFKDIWRGKQIDLLLEEHENNIFREPCRNCNFYTSIYSRENRLNDNRLNWS
jgi:radical SAM protein with 4Fe4S-binding SPASM domain